MTASDSTYTLDNTWEKAHRRLRLLETVYDPGTISRLTALGVGPGWRCMEVAAGAGSIARWLCDRVGQSGTVTAVDLDPRFLELDPHPDLEIVRRDVVADGLPGDGYDLVHVRALLMHLPRPDELIAEMVARLRPGGVLLVEEGDFHPMFTSTSDLYRELAQACCDVVAEIGGNWCWGRHLPASLTAAGLTGVVVDTFSPIFPGGGLWSKLVDMTWEQLTPLLADAGFAPERIAKATSELYDADRWFPACGLVAASGRRPA